MTCCEIQPTPKEWLQLLPASLASGVDIIAVDVPLRANPWGEAIIERGSMKNPAKLIASVAVIATATLGQSALNAEGILPYQDSTAIRAGKQIYGEQCAACHGDNLEGQPNWKVAGEDGRLPAPPHDATGHSWHHPDTQLFLITKYGTQALVGGTYKSDMKGFGDILSDTQILEVLAYIKSTWPRRVADRHTEISKAAASN